ncbi:hypothetical protein CAPTEDRAFT_199207 [Capitella teleta]|uniref:Chitin-binding type-2 domain-containing protein n=1 Tax=Capitella teleta TaxID=283909 RepID=R7T606_CAPTE|nr:hypothetical protein CAPTEDRAFT_199207 [Capitella teleta]|eukprot:ELT88765.1 hypothetical protein CAPTEDRAFT_199207 [Capitella teleta]
MLLQKQSLATGEETINADDDEDEDVETPFSEVVSTTVAPTPPPMDDDGSGEEPIGYTCEPDNSPCNGEAGRCNFNFPHVDSGKHVRCNEWGTQCFEINCPPGLALKIANQEEKISIKQ